MNKYRNKVLFVSLFAVLVTVTGCKEDFNLRYDLIPAKLNPDKKDLVFNANANESVIMTNAAEGSTWFVRREGDVPATVLQTTDRVIISVAVNDAVNDTIGELKAKAGKIILSEETAGGLVVDKVTITVTQQHYRQSGSTGTTDWDNGNPPAYSWTYEGKGADGQDDQVTIGGLEKDNTYAYRILGGIAKNIDVEDTGKDASRTLKLSAKRNDSDKKLKGYLMITDKDGKIIYAVRPLTIDAKPE